MKLRQLLLWVLFASVFSTQSQADVLSPSANTSATELNAEAFYFAFIAELYLIQKQYTQASDALTHLGIITSQESVFERAYDIAALSKDHALALEITQKWQDLFPQSQLARSLQIVSLLNLGEFDKITQAISLTLLHSPKAEHPALVFEFMRQLAQMSNKPAVIKLANHIHTLAPSAEGYSLLAAMYAQQPEKSFAAAIQALTLDPQYQPAIVWLMRQFEVDTQVAKEHLERFFALNPQEHDLRSVYVQVLAEHQDIKAAIQHMNFIVTHDPKTLDTLVVLAHLLLLDGQTHEAQQTLLSYLQSATMSTHERGITTTHLELARIALDANQPSQAIDQWQQIAVTENSLPIILRQAFEWIDAGHKAKAFTLLEHLKTDTPESERLVLRMRVQMLNRTNEQNQAFALLEKFIAMHPEDIEMKYETALFAQTIGQTDLSQRYLREIIAKDAEHVEALNALGYLLADNDQSLDEAETLIKKALSLKLDDAYILDSLGWVYYKQNRYEESLIYLNIAYSQQPNAEIAAHLGEVLWVLGKFDDARQIWSYAQRNFAENKTLTATIKRFDQNLLQSIQN